MCSTKSLPLMGCLCLLCREGHPQGGRGAPTGRERGTHGGVPLRQDWLRKRLRRSCLGAVKSSSGVVISTICPWSMKTMRWAAARAKGHPRGGAPTAGSG